MTEIDERFQYWKTIPRVLRAREVQESGELIECYNGSLYARKGDFVVIDEEGRVVVHKRNKFLQRYFHIGEDYGNE